MILASLVAVVTAFLALSLTMDSLHNERRVMSKNMVEMAHNVISRKYQFYQEGKLPSEEAAKKAAIAALRNMTYGEEKSGYYFIYERNGTTVLMNPKPSMEGQNFINLTDPNGVKLIAELSKVSANGQGGFVRYHWAKPGYDDPQPKISYAKGFAPWDWFVGTGNYEADLRNQVVGLMKRNAVLVVLSTLFFLSLVVALFVINGVTIRQVLSLQKHLAAFAKGDFSKRITDEGKDEFGQIFSSMRQVQSSMHKTIGQLSDTVDTVGSGVSEIATSNQNLASRTEEQASNIARSSHNLSQIAGLVRENSNSLVEASDLAKQSEDTVVRGEKVVQEAIGAMSRITSSSDKVTEIINVIDEIAFQTNLLALNAAVEAARAGDQGRGFAVVASEVRTLAQRSATSANEIKGLIEESAQNVKTGSELVSASGDILEEILASSRQVGKLMNEISTSTQEQTQSIESTSQAVTEVDAFVQENAAMVQEVAVSGSSLKSEVDVLRQLVAYFDIGTAGSHGGAMSANRVQKTASRQPSFTASNERASQPSFSTQEEGSFVNF